MNSKVLSKSSPTDNFWECRDIFAAVDAFVGEFRSISLNLRGGGVLCNDSEKHASHS